MSTDATDATAETFAASLDRVGVGLTRTTAEDAAAAIADAVEPPAVGTPIPQEDVNLEDVDLGGAGESEREGESEGVTVDPTPAEIEAATTGITAVGLGIAEYGSVVIEGTPAGEEPASLFVERHVAVLAASDLVADVDAAIEYLAAFAQESGDAVIATGPSATADMGELVLGAHGPESVHVVLVGDR